MKKNKIHNSVIVESFDGDRAFLLLEGDIFIEQADVYIFNSYKDKSGMLIQKLKEIYGPVELPESAFYFSPEGTRVSKISLANGPMILLLHPDIEEYESISVDQYKALMNTVFMSLVALEALGEKFETVAFPILLRKSLSNIYSKAIEVLVDKVMRWLKTSENTKTIKYVLFENSDAKRWNEHLNRVLGRKAIDVVQSLDLYRYRNKALFIIQMMNKKFSYWSDTLLPIQNALENEDFQPEVVAAFSRKLLEVYCHQQTESNIHLDGTLNSYLRYISENNLLNMWDVQKLYQIRSFGNPSIHRPNPLLGPKSMTERDVTILLISLCKLLELLNELVGPSDININQKQTL